MRLSVIALGRQFGSVGREIGKRLANHWGIPCYDRELITLAAEKAKLHEELFFGKEEKAAMAVYRHLRRRPAGSKGPGSRGHPIRDAKPGHSGAGPDRALYCCRTMCRCGPSLCRHPGHQLICLCSICRPGQAPDGAREHRAKRSGGFCQENR